MTFLIATKNAHKLLEIQRVLTPLGIDCICENDLPEPLPEVDETGVTFAENARLKAESARAATGLPVIADDSGLCVDALGGAPGVLSARYASEHGDSAANMKKLLAALDGRENRAAHFCCAVCCLLPDNEPIEVEGRCSGSIMPAPHGTGGFGYDPVFMSEHGGFAELTDEQKDQISHRGRALTVLAERLDAYISGKQNG